MQLSALPEPARDIFPLGQASQPLLIVLASAWYWSAGQLAQSAGAAGCVNEPESHTQITAKTGRERCSTVQHRAPLANRITDNTLPYVGSIVPGYMATTMWYTHQSSSHLLRNDSARQSAHVRQRDANIWRGRRRHRTNCSWKRMAQYCVGWLGI